MWVHFVSFFGKSLRNFNMRIDIDINITWARVNQN